MTEETVNEMTDDEVDAFFESGGDLKKEESATEEEKVIPAPLPEQKPEVAIDGKVNYGALHEERMKRKEIQAELERFKQENEQLKAGVRPQQQPAVQEPSFEEDPVEVLRRENEQIKQVLLAQFNKATESNEAAVFRAKLNASEAAFKQDAPDVEQAIKFLGASRLEELKELGWNDQEAAKILSDEVKWIANKAYQDGVNPAEKFYNLAKKRGYALKQSTTLEDDVEEFFPSAKIDNTRIEAKLDAIEKGLKTNKALPNGSKGGKENLTVESLLDMNVGVGEGKEFDAAWQKLFG